MKIIITPPGSKHVYIEMQVHGRWVELDERERERLFNAIDAIKGVKANAHASYALQHGETPLET